MSAARARCAAGVAGARCGGASSCLLPTHPGALCPPAPAPASTASPKARGAGGGGRRRRGDKVSRTTASDFWIGHLRVVRKSPTGSGRVGGRGGPGTQNQAQPARLHRTLEGPGPGPQGLKWSTPARPAGPHKVLSVAASLSPEKEAWGRSTFPRCPCRADRVRCTLGLGASPRPRSCSRVSCAPHPHPRLWGRTTAQRNNSPHLVAAGQAGISRRRPWRIKPFLPAERVQFRVDGAAGAGCSQKPRGRRCASEGAPADGPFRAAGAPSHR